MEVKAVKVEKVETAVGEAARDALAAKIDELVSKAAKAQLKMMALNQQQVDAIVKAMALAGIDNHMVLARMAYEETGMGVYEDKVTKNLFATEYVYHDIKNEKTVGVVEENEEEGYIKIAEPVGIVAWLDAGDQPYFDYDV